MEVCEGNSCAHGYHCYTMDVVIGEEWLKSERELDDISDRYTVAVK